MMQVGTVYEYAKSMYRTRMIITEDHGWFWLCQVLQCYKAGSKAHRYSFAKEDLARDFKSGKFKLVKEKKKCL